MGAPLACQDGWRGKVAGILLWASSAQAVHLLVRQSPFSRRETMLPLDTLSAWDEDSLQVELSSQQLARMPSWKGTTRSGLAASPELIASPQAVLSTPESKDHPSQNMVRIGKGTQVFGSAGTLGQVSAVLLQAKSRLVHSLVLRRGWPFTLELLLPFDRVQRLQGESILTGMDAGGWRALPIYKRDDEITRNVQYALYNYDPLPATDYYGIEVETSDGVVKLRGNVRFPATISELERVTKGLAGVLGVKNLLISDREIELEVAAALARDPLTRPLGLVITAFVGRVRLEGKVPSPEVRKTALKIARETKGVRGVVDALTLRPGGVRAGNPLGTKVL